MPASSNRSPIEICEGPSQILPNPSNPRSTCWRMWFLLCVCVEPRPFQTFPLSTSKDVIPSHERRTCASPMRFRCGSDADMTARDWPFFESIPRLFCLRSLPKKDWTILYRYTYHHLYIYIMSLQMKTHEHGTKETQLKWVTQNRRAPAQSQEC